MNRFDFYDNLDKYKELKHSANVKYYQKIELPSGETRYFYTKEEWDAYNNPQKRREEEIQKSMKTEQHRQQLQESQKSREAEIQKAMKTEQERQKKQEENKIKIEQFNKDKETAKKYMNAARAQNTSNSRAKKLDQVPESISKLLTKKLSEAGVLKGDHDTWKNHIMTCLEILDKMEYE